VIITFEIDFVLDVQMSRGISTYHYKAESDWYYISSLLHFNKKRTISKPELPDPAALWNGE